MITVTTTANTISTDGQCSLREAIINANNDATTHADCAAGSGADTIELASSATYTLDVRDGIGKGYNGLPTITSEILIEGNGAKITRSGAAQTFRLFYVASGAASKLTLRNLTLSNGLTQGGTGSTGGAGGGGGAGLGGAIYNNGMVELVNCTLTSNQAVGGGGANSNPSDTFGQGGGGGGGLGSSGSGGAGGAGGSSKSPGENGSFGCGGGGGGSGSGSGAPGGSGGFGGGGGGGGYSSSSGGGSNFGGGNGSSGGGCCGPAHGAGGGGAGMGGAIFNEGGTLILTNCTFSANVGRGANGGSGEVVGSVGSAGGGGGSGYGGALFNYNGTATLTQCTFNANSVTGGTGGTGRGSGSNGQTNGSAIYNLQSGGSATVNLNNNTIPGDQTITNTGGGTVTPNCSAPVINTQPNALTVCAGSSASFTVTATGTSLSYQWRKGGVNLTDGGNISGATTATLTINPAAAGEAGNYDVVVTEVCGQATTSSAAALTVNGFSLSPASLQIAPGSGGGYFNVTADSGGCSWTAVSNAPWITINPGSESGTGNGFVFFTTTFNTDPTPRTGTITAAGQTLTVTQPRAHCITSLGHAELPHAPSGGTGTFIVSAPVGCDWTLVVDSYNPAPGFSLTSAASGVGNGTVGYAFAATATNSARAVTVQVGNNSDQVRQLGVWGAGCTTTPISFGQTVNGDLSSGDCISPTWPNNAYADRYSFSGLTGQQVALSVTGLFQPFVYLIGPAGAVVAAAETGSSPATIPVFPPGALFTLPADGTYMIEVTSFTAATTGNYALTLSSCAPATITTQPVNQTACATYNATFIAAASGDPAPSVQWQVSTDNGANFSDLPGATNAALMLSGLTTAMTGNQYRAVFTNSCGTATSNAATLTVNTLTINPAAVPDGVLGSAYSQAFTATGGLGIPSVGYNGSVPGLSFNSAAATLAGTPTLAGSFPFNISAVESACNGNRGYTLKVGLLNLAATGAEGRVDLNWTHSGFSGVNGFKLYRATAANGLYTLVNGALGAGQSAVNDSSVTPNTVYWYKLTVVRADGVESSFSNPAAATPVDVVAPVITHTPFVSPQPPGVALLLAATVTDNTAVQSVKLFFRTTGAGSYTERTMTGSGSNYAATLAANEVVTPGLDYYLEASDGISVARSGQSDNPQRITVVDQPFLNGLTPTTGPAAGGTTVTLNGQNFSANAVVRFDNALATITSVSATQIVCTTPPHFPATVDVRVTNPNGTNGVKVGAFEYTGTQAALSLPANAASPQGVRVQIPVNAAGVQGLTAADVRFTFDNAVISAVSTATGTLTPGWSLQANLATPGEVRLALASNSGPVSGTGTLAVVEFDVLGAPASTSALNFGVAMLNGGAIAVATTNGLFTVAPVYSIAGTVRQWFTNLGLSNVALTLNQQGGTRSYTATSQASGAYTVNSVLGGDYTLTPRKFDQAVGITSQDAVKVLLHSIGITPLSGHALTAADVNRNGTANTQDAFSILQYVVGLINLPFPGAGRVWDFAPQTRSYTNLNSDQTGQDFTGILLGDVTGNYTQPPNRPVNPATVATLALPGVTLLPNSQTTLLLGLDLPQGQLLSGELRINYDPAVLSIVGVESGALVSDWLQAANTETPGLLRIALAGSRAVTTGGEFLRITVQTSGAPGVSSALSIAQGNLNDGEIGATLIPGAVTTASSPTALLVSGIAPASGPTSGGTSVTISGANFTPNATVIIGGVAATNVTFVDAQTLRATTGGHAAGLADVVVTQAGSGSSTLVRGFSYSNGNVCQAALATTTQRFPATGGTGSVQVTTGSGCTWTVDSHSEWITPVTSGGTGNGVVQFTVARNTGLERTGWLTIAGQSFVITQGAKNASADFDGDGKTDLAVWRGATGNWLILRSTNSAVQSFTWGTSNAPYEDLIVPADYDGDGKADTAVWRQLDGTWYIVNSATGATTAQAWGTRGDVPVAGDYDGDGKADLAVWRPGDGRWYVWRSSDGGYTIEAWGQQGDLVVPGDYDGDGRADLAIWRPGNGTWYIKRSSGGTQVTAWGAGYAPYFDVPVQADYDGDGKTDLAIWRGADSLWYIRRSSDGQPITQLWGANYAPYRDVPVPGDYDGDGKADIAVWRPTSATWFVLHSTDGSFLVQPHGQSGDTPVSAVGVR